MSQPNERQFFIDLYENEQGQHTCVRRYVDGLSPPEPLWTLSNLEEVEGFALRLLRYVRERREEKAYGTANTDDS